MHWRLLKWVCLSVRRRNMGALCECNSSNSISLIFLKRCRCFVLGLKMCMSSTFQLVNIVIFSHLRYNEKLHCESLLQFYSTLFETLQMFCTWSEDVHVVWALS